MRASRSACPSPQCLLPRRCRTPLPSRRRNQTAAGPLPGQGAGPRGRCRATRRCRAAGGSRRRPAPALTPVRHSAEDMPRERRWLGPHDWGRALALSGGCGEGAAGRAAAPPRTPQMASPPWGRAQARLQGNGRVRNAAALPQRAGGAHLRPGIVRAGPAALPRPQLQARRRGRLGGGRDGRAGQGQQQPQGRCQNRAGALRLHG